MLYSKDSLSRTLYLHNKPLALSDCDLLTIKKDENIKIKPHEIEPLLDASVFEASFKEIEEKVYWNSIILAAILEGKVILDNLSIGSKLINESKGKDCEGRGFYIKKRDKVP